MDIALACIVGAAWGGLVGLAKYFVFWRPVFKKMQSGQTGTKSIMGRYGVSVLLDIAALFLPFLLKEYLPFSLQFVLIGTALALVLTNRLYSAGKISKLVGEDEQSGQAS